MAKENERSHDDQYKKYISDCLWAGATDMRFLSDGIATLPRWNEPPVIKKTIVAPPEITKESIKNNLIQMKKR